MSRAAALFFFPGWMGPGKMTDGVSCAQGMPLATEDPFGYNVHYR